MAKFDEIPSREEIHKWFVKTSAYAGLILLTVLLIGQFGINRVIAPLQPSTAKIEAASGQVLRAQKISALSDALARAKKPGRLYTFRTELASELNEFVRVHKGLIYGDRELGLDGKLSPGIKDLLLDSQNGLDRFARDFEDRVRGDFLGNALTVEDDLAESLQMDIAQDLSPRIRNLVSGLSDEITASYKQVVAVQYTYVAVLLSLMLGLSRFFYRPLAEKTVRAIHDFAQKADQNAVKYDEITGLANRTHLQSFVTDLCVLNQTHKTKSAVLDIQVLGLDQINEKLDPENFDELSSMIARRLESVCRSGDFIARVSSDEYVVILTGLGDGNTLNDITNSLRTKLSLPFNFDDLSFGLTTKIGIKVTDERDHVATTVLNQAATALKIAKASNNYDIQFFSGNLATGASQREKEYKRIANAIKDGQFTAYFQPIVDAESDQTLGMEALIRWNDPKRGTLSPIHFMETVKHRDMNDEITRIVLGESLKALREWRADGINIPYISINLESEQLLSVPFIEELRWIVDSYEQNPSSIAFELSEKLLTSSSDSKLTDNISFLSEIGFKIVLDDFGTHGQVLDQVGTIQPSHVKIDRAFITNIDSETQHQSASGHIIKQAHFSSLTVIAEGVETRAERSALERMGIDAIQGFLVCEPISFADMTQWLENREDLNGRAKGAA